MQFCLDGLMLEALAETKQKKPQIYKRLLRASDLLFCSYFNDPYVNIDSRMLLTIAAFEVLLNLPDDSHQRKKFKEMVAKYDDLPDERKVTYRSERSRGPQPETATRKVKWADRLYVLRNHIIHGNKVKPIEYSFDGKQRHIDIAMLFFIFLVRAKINKSLRREIFIDRIEWKKYVDNNGDDVEYEGFEFGWDGRRRRLS